MKFPDWRCVNFMGYSRYYLVNDPIYLFRVGNWRLIGNHHKSYPREFDERTVLFLLPRPPSLCFILVLPAFANPTRVSSSNVSQQIATDLSIYSCRTTGTRVLICSERRFPRRRKYSELERSIDRN